MPNGINFGPSPERNGAGALLNPIRESLRKIPGWIRFQEINREGWRQAAYRANVQRKILTTRPIKTPTSGPIEIHMLTWRRDWINSLWTLKSFFSASQEEFPIVFHDGGLDREGFRALRTHFPNARVISRQEADQVVETYLKSLGHLRSLEYRRKNISTLKVFDFFLTTKAEQIISIDPDILFYSRPSDLLNLKSYSGKNLYNRDCQYAYSLSMDELERLFGIRPPSHINSGLSRIAHTTWNYEQVEHWLKEDRLFNDRWVTEQTLHALASTLHGVDLLPESYFVDVKEGFPENVICKHYPGFFRPLLYSEGMKRLLKENVLFEKYRLTG